MPLRANGGRAPAYMCYITRRSTNVLKRSHAHAHACHTSIRSCRARTYVQYILTTCQLLAIRAGRNLPRAHHGPVHI